MHELLKQFKVYLQEKDSSVNTISAYLSDLKKFAEWYRQTEGSYPDMRSVGPLDLAEFKRHLVGKNQKPATVNRAITALSVFFGWLGVPNPAEGIKLLPEVKSAPRALSRKELLSLIRAVQSSGSIRDVAVVTLLLHTGVRVSELCALTLEDVVMRERSGRIVVRSGKGNKRREVPLNSTARSAVTEWLKIRGDAPGALFTGRKGSSLTPRAVEYLLKKYSSKAGLENVTPHVFRHTFCKSLVDAGEPLDRVATLAGHENLNTTAKYTKATGRDLQKAVEKLAWE